MSLFWRSVRRYPLILWPLLLSVPINVVLNDFVAPYIVSNVLSRLSTGEFDATNIWGSFGPSILGYSAAVIGAGIIGWRITVWLIWQLGATAQRDLAMMVFDHLMKMSPGFHSNRFSGSLVSQANKLTSAFERITDSIIFNVIPMITTLIATVVILAPRAPVFAWLVVVMSACFIAGTYFFSRSVRITNARESSLQNKQTGFLADSVSNIFAIKTFARARHESERYRGAANNVLAASFKVRSASIRRENYAALFTTILRIGAILLAVIGVGVLRTDIATIFLMVTYTGILTSQLWEFQYVLRQFNRAFGDSEEMVKILSIKPEIKDAAQPEPSRITQGSIAFSDVTFAHPGTPTPLFDKFNLNIKPGERIGLVGHSGSGKTSLTRLLLRFSDIDGGTIAIDGQDIARITQDDLHSAISYVPQEPLLFHRSLRENIAYGQPNATLEDIRTAARRAHAAEFIERLPEGYDTLVGERGIKLSGGQRQRIVIARAMLKTAPILVLDEATSALDSQSEKLIQAALWELMEGRTAIVIAHRLSTIQRLDRIVVLDHGRIAEQGSHAELLAAGGTYAELWAHQSGGFIEEDAEDAAAE